MTEYVITLLAAAAVTYILTPLVRRFAIAVGAMHAARERDVHELPTPLLGGFAIYGGLVVALLLASRLSGLNSVFTETNLAKGLLLAGGLVVIMGFVDDRWGMGALSKLAGQVAAGVILVWSGAEIPWLPEPGGVTLILTSDQQVAVTILVVVVTMNAVNFIDGLDGLAAGIVGIGAIAFFAYYFTLVHRLGLLDQSEPALVSVLLAGVCIGFLPHNFYPARIFMGDTGSMLIGLLLAYAPISSLALLDPASLTDTQAYAAGTVNRYGAFIPLLVPAAILLIPYADLLMAVVRRTRAGKSVFAPDKKHLQHRLLAIGHSHRTSVLIMYLWAAVFSGTVILLSIVRTPLYVLAIVTVAAVMGLLLVTMPRLRPWSRGTAGDGAAGGHALRPGGPARSSRCGPSERAGRRGRGGCGAGWSGSRPWIGPPGGSGCGAGWSGSRSWIGPPGGSGCGAELARQPQSWIGPPGRSRCGAGWTGSRSWIGPPGRSGCGAGPGGRPGKHGRSGCPAASIPAPDRPGRGPGGSRHRAAGRDNARHEGNSRAPSRADRGGGRGRLAADRPPRACQGSRGQRHHGERHGAGNGGVPGKGRAGNGAGGNGAAPAKGRKRKDSAAGPGTPAATPEDEAGSPVTRAAGPGGWSWEAAGTLPPRNGGRAVPPWEADDAGPSPEPAGPPRPGRPAVARRPRGRVPSRLWRPAVPCRHGNCPRRPAAPPFRRGRPAIPCRRRPRTGRCPLGSWPSRPIRTQPARIRRCPGRARSAPRRRLRTGQGTGPLPRHGRPPPRRGGPPLRPGRRPRHLGRKHGHEHAGVSTGA